VESIYIIGLKGSERQYFVCEQKVKHGHTTKLVK